MMGIEDIQRIGVIGSGTMGSGIAQLAAQAGYDVVLYDLQAEALKRASAAIGKNLAGAVKRGKMDQAAADAALARIQFTHAFPDLDVDLAIEAIIEKLEVKTELFERLADLNGPECILATNTSSIPITAIARPTPSPERVVGLHFFNPAHIMKLVEVISGAHTAPEVAKTAAALAVKMGKKAVMAKDAPGFIVNRVARHFYVEGLKVLEEGVADHAAIDRLMRATGFKMGPFELMDLIGVDTNFSVTSSMFESFHQDSKFRPSRIQEQAVRAGFHGRKSGRGFYRYDEE